MRGTCACVRRMGSSDRLRAGRDLVTHAAQVAEGRLKVSMSFVLGRPLVGALHRLNRRPLSPRQTRRRWISSPRRAARPRQAEPTSSRGW